MDRKQSLFGVQFNSIVDRNVGKKCPIILTITVHPSHHPTSSPAPQRERLSNMHSQALSTICTAIFSLSACLQDNNSRYLHFTARFTTEIKAHWIYEAQWR